ncbi:hypothetical protein GUJ93_ZPchr0010g7911 [Zizania palustris]|uniref:Uncharacterized protein n=1 Tax=Zizania palustris TaxID=103762 RepID=A0A8J6BBQ3_ZIZPA|nr:hypothetical protein GUJ93_ZPchr0010g7911 [Zizania palustris]
MDVYISEEYVAQRRAEKRAARRAVMADGEESKARACGGGERDDGRRMRWTAAWAGGSEKGSGNASAVVGREEDVVLSYFSA